MPKAVQYRKGSIIYFENDIDERIYILQKGSVRLSSTNIESGTEEISLINTGEFFGVKSALGHFPREETATVMEDSLTISMTVQEFETIFVNKKDVVYKMLRVFSGQLREVHNKTELFLAGGDEMSNEEGMLTVAKTFFREEKYRSCMDVCQKFLKLFPYATEKAGVEKLYEHSKRFAEKQASKKQESRETTYMGPNSALAHFMLPAFERFQKRYEDGQVIICEYEPGDSFYLIQSGQVQLTKCVNETIKNLDILKPGEFFGEMAILDNSPRSATCVAAGPLQCLEFNKQNFELLVTGNPQIAIILLKLFCKRIFDQKRRWRILTLQDTSARIADVFCMYDEMNPPSKPNEKSRQINTTVQDIAHWTGLPTEMVQDEIDRLSAKNKIQVYDKYMVVTNISDMKRVVEIRLQQMKLQVKH